MQCPKCDGATSVLETRQTRRRRICSACGFRFTTIETWIEKQAKPKPEPKPTPEPAAPRVSKAKAKAQARLSARREIENRRWSREDDWFSADNDYLPEA
jgi:predicted house-cleaning NTP pyrophosphatase (Maf/HAM1 superfamily)